MDARRLANVVARMKLPRHLESWSRDLDLFSDDIALALGNLVVRLSAIVGDVDVRPCQLGDFDGYDGISRRGPMHRLLMSEWALLDEAPDEFLRRVIATEQAFLAPALITPTSEQHCAVFLDTGGDVLGGPRVVQLALMLVLSARAARHHMRVTWSLPGIVHTFDQLSVTFVKRWLQARRHASPTADELVAWRAQPHVRNANERWLLGGATLNAMSGNGESRITLTESANPSLPSTVCVAVNVAWQRARAVSLLLPGPSIATRLLRDPFRAAHPGKSSMKTTMDRQTNLLLARDGRRIFARGVNNTLVMIPFPNSPRGQTGNPKQVSVLGGRLFAVGQSSSNSRTLIACTTDSTITVHRMSKAGNTTAMSYPFSVDAAAPRIGPHLHSLSEVGQHQFVFADDDGVIFGLRQGSVTRLATSALATYVQPDSFAFIVEQNGVAKVQTVLRSAQVGEFGLGEGRKLCNLDGPIITACFGPGPRYAVRHGTTWSIMHGADDPISRRVQPNVVGVVPWLVKQSPALVALGEQRCTVTLVGESNSTVIATTTAAIRTITVGDNYSHIAWLTEANELTVYSVEAETALLSTTVRVDEQ
jgi:hypothetical protein